jgi:hypothetical protein
MENYNPDDNLNFPDVVRFLADMRPYILRFCRAIVYGAATMLLCKAQSHWAAPAWTLGFAAFFLAMPYRTSWAGDVILAIRF